MFTNYNPTIHIEKIVRNPLDGAHEAIPEDAHEEAQVEAHMDVHEENQMDPWRCPEAQERDSSIHFPHANDTRKVTYEKLFETYNGEHKKDNWFRFVKRYFL